MGTSVSPCLEPGAAVIRANGARLRTKREARELANQRLRITLEPGATVRVCEDARLARLDALGRLDALKGG